MRSKGHIEPHHSHLPRHPTKAKKKTKDVLLPLPLSAVNTVTSTIRQPLDLESEFHAAVRSAPAPVHVEASPTSPLGLGISSTIAALISAAQLLLPLMKVAQEARAPTLTPILQVVCLRKSWASYVAGRLPDMLAVLCFRRARGKGEGYMFGRRHLVIHFLDHPLLGKVLKMNGEVFFHLRG